MSNHILKVTTLILFLLTYSCNNHNNYYVLVEFDKVDGLKEKTDVLINGFKVGSVVKLELSNNKVMATLAIDIETKISDQSIFIIRSSDLLGNKHIVIDNFDGSDIQLADGDKVQGIYDGEIISTTISIDSLVLKVAKPILDSLGYDVKPKQKN